MNEENKKIEALDEQKMGEVSGGSSGGSTEVRCAACPACHFPVGAEFNKGSNRFVCIQCGHIFAYEDRYILTYEDLI